MVSEFVSELDFDGVAGRLQAGEDVREKIGARVRFKELLLLLEKLVVGRFFGNTISTEPIASPHRSRITVLR